MPVTEGSCSCAHAPCEHDAARDPSFKTLVKLAREPSAGERPVIVGESNPFGGDEYFAMFPEPQGCAGDRLCRLVMGLQQETYLKQFQRVNLLRGDRWSAPRAREAASALCARFQGSRVWVLLGKKVAEAFSLQGHTAPAVLNSGTMFGNTAVLLPHPSGRNRAWHDPLLRLHCRDALAGQLPSIPFGELEREKGRARGSD